MEPVESPTSELSKLSSEGREVPTSQGPVMVAPLRFTKLLQAIKHLTPLIDLIEKMMSEEQELSFKDLLNTAPEAMLKVAALSTGKPEAFFDTIEPDQALDILIATFEVNQAFFVERLLPKLAGLGAKLGAQGVKVAAKKLGEAA